MDYVLIDEIFCKKKQIVFSGCGGMLPYYFGIAKYLQENYKLDNIIFGGVSGGAIISSFLTLDEKIDKIFEIISKDLCEEIQNSKTGALFNMLDILRDYLEKYYKENYSDDVYKKINNNLFISVSSIYPKQETIIYNWKDNTDLIDCIVASCSLPLLGNSLFREYRDAYCLDGCFYNNKPILYSDLPTLVITPYKWRYIPPSWFTIGCNIEWYKELYELGYNDAKKNSSELDDFFI